MATGKVKLQRAALSTPSHGFYWILKLKMLVEDTLVYQHNLDHLQPLGIKITRLVGKEIRNTEIKSK